MFVHQSFPVFYSTGNILVEQIQPILFIYNVLVICKTKDAKILEIIQAQSHQSTCIHVLSKEKTNKGYLIYKWPFGIFYPNNNFIHLYLKNVKKWINWKHRYALNRKVKKNKKEHLNTQLLTDIVKVHGILNAWTKFPKQTQPCSNVTV